MTKKKGEAYWVIMDVKSVIEPKAMKKELTKATGIKPDCIAIFKRVDKKR